MAHLPPLDRAAKWHRPGGNQDSRRTIQLSFSHVDLPGRPLFTKKSLCVYLVISQSTLDRLVSAGKLASRPHRWRGPLPPRRRGELHHGEKGVAHEGQAAGPLPDDRLVARSLRGGWEDPPSGTLQAQT